jgi:hypothetical protein
MQMSDIVVIKGRRITASGQLGPDFTGDDGIGMYQDGKTYLVENCIVDFSDLSLDQQDEATAVTYGASATFRRCVLRGAGKLCLCGCGDDEKVPVETGKKVELYDCILEDFGRRGPEVQDGMQVIMHGCLIRNWGAADRFTVRNFGSWAHKGGRITAVNCVFWQDSFWRPLRQMWQDWTDHIGQAWNDEGWRGLLRPSTYLPGVCRGLFATNGGEAWAMKCWKNRWWIALPWRHTTKSMDKMDAKILMARLEKMAAELDAKLPKEAG